MESGSLGGGGGGGVLVERWSRGRRVAAKLCKLRSGRVTRPIRPLPCPTIELHRDHDDEEMSRTLEVAQEVVSCMAAICR